MNNSNRPLGIFDSGVGGLTVARAVTDFLPNESIVYFGDTAHMPYGDKSTAAIQAYSIKICDILLQHDVKAILIACNSASAAAYDLVKEYVKGRAEVMNVIDPMVKYVGKNFKGHTVGLIGTKQTVSSGVYDKKIKHAGYNVRLKSLATPLLAPMVEEGFFDSEVSAGLIKAYLSHPELENIEALILACTHYPLLKKQIMSFYGGSIPVIDSSEITAQALKRFLDDHHLSASEEGHAKKNFFVSDYTSAFETTAKIFFREEVSPEHVPLW